MSVSPCGYTVAELEAMRDPSRAISDADFRALLEKLRADVARARAKLAAR